MNGHTMRVTYNGRAVTFEAVCNEPEGANCRLTSVSCECEFWGEIRRDDDGRIWHRIIDGSETEPQWHEIKPADYCNVELSINESGWVEELGPREKFIIGEFPINPVWIDDGCEWERGHPEPSALEAECVRLLAENNQLREQLAGAKNALAACREVRTQGDSR
jgi:hypothetical protein